MESLDTLAAGVLKTAPEAAPEAAPDAAPEAAPEAAPKAPPEAPSDPAPGEKAVAVVAATSVAGRLPLST